MFPRKLTALARAAAKRAECRFRPAALNRPTCFRRNGLILGSMG